MCAFPQPATGQMYQVRYVAGPDDLERARVEVDARVFKDASNRGGPSWMAGLLEKCPRGLVVLEHDGRLWGRAHCLPLSDEAYRAVIHGAKTLSGQLGAGDVLGERAAMRRACERGRGNFLAVGAVVYDPAERRERYGAAAVPLFRYLLSGFYALRVRALVCQSESEAAEQTVVDAGCARVRSMGRTADGDRVLWRFDRETAEARPASGLGAIFHSLWHAAPGQANGLTEAELRILGLTSRGYRDQDAADLLGIELATVRKHWENMRRKVGAALPGHGPRVTREYVITLYQLQPMESLGPGSAAPAREHAPRQPWLQPRCMPSERARCLEAGRPGEVTAEDLTATTPRRWLLA